MKDQNKKTGVLTGLIMIGCFLCSACGKSGNPNTDAGMEAVKNLNYGEAMACFDAAEAEGENRRMIARGRGIASIGMADYAGGADYLEEALQTGNGLVREFDYDVNYYLALAYVKSGQPEKAENVYNAILNLREDETECYFLRGTVRLQLDDPEGAEQDFTRAMELEPRNYDRVIRIYEVLSRSGYEEEGREYLRETLEGSEKMSAFDQGRIYYYLGNYEEACRILEGEKDGKKPEVSLYLGKAYEATGDYNYASSVYRSYLASDSENAGIYNQLGLCEMKRENYEEALKAFQAGMQARDNEIMQTLQFNEIAAYEYLHNFQQAEVLMDHYISIYPDDEQAKREYEFLLTR